MKSSKTGGFDQKIAYQMSGEGDTAVILIHGIPSSQDEWKFLRPELVSAGYTVLSLDLLGHGSSDQPEDPLCYTVEAAYRYFEDWLTSLKLESPIILVGHSFGGHLAIRYALAHPGDVRAAVLIDPFLSFRQMWRPNRFLFSNPALVAFFYKIIPNGLIKFFARMDNLRIEKFRIRSSLSEEELVAMAKDYKRCSPNVVYFPRSVSDQGFEYAGIKAPTLLVWGKRDVTLSTRWYEEIARKIPNCAFAILNARHYPHRTNYQEVNALILEFLKSKSI